MGQALDGAMTHPALPCHHRGVNEKREPRDADPTDPADDPAAAEPEAAYDLLMRGQALLERRHFAQAAIVLERADRQEPAKGSILEALGRAYFNSGQTERARATFEALLEVEPSSHYAHYALGQSLKRLGRTDRAQTHLRLAVALSPDDTLYAGALARLTGAPVRLTGAPARLRPSDAIGDPAVEDRTRHDPPGPTGAR